MVQENRIYILPSGRGILFLSSVIILILVAATYNNNLVFILAFAMFGLFFVTMLQTHYMLKGVRITFLSADDAFEGETLTLLFQLSQRRARRKRGLRVRSLSRKFVTVKQGREDLNAREYTKPIRVSLR